MTIIGENVMINYDNIVSIKKDVKEIEYVESNKKCLNCRLEFQGYNDTYYIYYDNKEAMDADYDQILYAIINNFKIVHI